MFNSRQLLTLITYTEIIQEVKELLRKDYSDDDVEALKNIVFASGNFSECNWIRAYESSEYKNVFEKGSQVMDSYVSSMVVAGNPK